MEEVKLNETQQLLACADDVNLFGGGGSPKLYSYSSGGWSRNKCR